MNFLMDKWIPVIRKDATKEVIAFWEITSNFASNPIVEVEIPRPDLKSAFYQFVIGILQVTIEPESEDYWEDLWNNPISTEELKSKFQEYADCFEIDSGEHPFMQDKSLIVDEKIIIPIERLLSTSPGQNAIDLNTDLFYKANLIISMDVYWASLALFSYQMYAPTITGGYFASIRGEAPLTTLISLKNAKTICPFWYQVWINVISAEYTSIFPGDKSTNKKEDIFHWMSLGKYSGDIYSNQVNPKSVYFSTPRRVCLSPIKNEKGVCSVSGVKSNKLVSTFARTKDTRIYKESWIHPFSPRKKDREGNYSHYKMKPSFLSYRYWLRFSYGSESCIIAQALKCFHEERQGILEDMSATIWVSGFEMKKAKAKSWCETNLPIFCVSKENQIYLHYWWSIMVEAAVDCSQTLLLYLHIATFSSEKRKDKKAMNEKKLNALSKGINKKFVDNKLETSLANVVRLFFEKTDPFFYTSVKALIDEESVSDDKPEVVKKWVNHLVEMSKLIFDELTGSCIKKAINIRNILECRDALVRKLNYLESMKELK